jgi:hypothetical protein
MKAMFADLESDDEQIIQGRLVRTFSRGEQDSRIECGRKAQLKWRRDTAFCIIAGMSDIHERPMIYNNVEQVHPYAGLERFSCASKAASSSTPSR